MARLTTIYSDFAKDIEEYMTAKLPDIPPATAKEIGAYISYKCSILVSDLFVEQVRRDKLEASRRRNSICRDLNESKEVHLRPPIKSNIP